MSLPFISVIVPSFNRAHCLSRCLQSIIDQSLPQNLVEIIVVDDGSTDVTQALLRDNFPEVTCLSQDNAGVSAARNLGVKAAQGEWIALLDSDDEWLPNKLELQLALLRKQELLVCHTEEIWIRNGVRVNQMKKHAKRGGWIFEHCLPLCAMSPSSIMIHQKVFDRIGLFDELLPACEDYDLWLRLTAEFEVAFVSTPQIKKYGGHDDQLSRQHWGMDRFRIHALEKILAQSTLDDRQVRATRSMLQKKLSILLTGAEKRGNQALVTECRLKLQRYENFF